MSEHVVAINLGHFEAGLVARALIELDEREGLGTVPPRLHRAFASHATVTVVTTTEEG